MLMTQLAPGFSVVPHVVLDTVNLLDPLMLQEKLISAPVPVLLMVSAFVELLPRVTAP